MELTVAFARAGASAVSVLVDERFGGSLADLKAARTVAPDTPLLAKGFFREELQLLQLKLAGADAALLLLRDLDDDRMRALMAYATELRLETLVEAHDAAELERAVALNAPVIGLNSRDLSTFRIDRRAQLDLVARAPRDRVVIAESGIESRAQAAAAELAGADAVLVGSTLMRAKEPAAKVRELPVAAARQGLRAHARGGRRRRRGSRRRPRRLHPREGEPAPREARARGSRHDAVRRGLRRGCRGHERRPDAALRARGRPSLAATRRCCATANVSRPSSTFRGSRPMRRTSSGHARPKDA